MDGFNSVLKNVTQNNNPTYGSGTAMSKYISDLNTAIKNLTTSDSNLRDEITELRNTLFIIDNSNVVVSTLYNSDLKFTYKDSIIDGKAYLDTVELGALDEERNAFTIDSNDLYAWNINANYNSATGKDDKKFVFITGGVNSELGNTNQFSVSSVYEDGSKKMDIYEVLRLT